MSPTGIGLIAIPISTAIACRLSIGNKVIYGLTINKYNEHKKQYEKDQRKIKSFDKLYKTSLHVNVIDNNEYESLCIFVNNHLDQTENQSFL